GDGRRAPRVQGLFAERRELLQALGDRVGCGGGGGTFIAVQRLGLGLRLYVLLFERHVRRLSSPSPWTRATPGGDAPRPRPGEGGAALGLAVWWSAGGADLDGVTLAALDLHLARLGLLGDRDRDAQHAPVVGG